jgi:L-malate glycosyltransferase
MKVLYFTRIQSPHDLRFTQALSETLHQVSVLCLEPDLMRVWPNGIKEIGWQGIDAKHGWPVMRGQVARLKKVLDDLKPDLVHAGPIQGPAYLTALAGFHPLVSMSWGSDLMLDANKDEEWRRVTRFTLERSDVLVGDCDCVSEQAASFGLDLKYYKKFPWGVDLQHFSPSGSSSLRQELSWQDKIVFLSTRALEPLYGADVLVKAFAAAAKTNPELRLMIFNKGSLESSLKNYVISQGLANVIRFMGLASLKQLPDIYRSADIYLSASHSDGSSVSLMEALACGLPALVSDIPGNCEWVREGEQGWLFKDGDISSFSHKILLAASQIAQLDRMKKNNRLLAEGRADWSKNFPVLLAAYNLAVERNAAHG